MKILKLFTIACILLHGGIASAQKKLFTGFYVANNGDTIHGNFPGYTQWSKSPDKVEFTTTGTATVQLLSPLNCKGFIITGHDEYISYSGKRLINTIDDNDLVNNKFFLSPDDVYDTVHAFIRLVTSTAIANLYILKDKKRTNFFYQLPQQQATEFKYKKVIVQNQIQEVNDYKKQLTEVFGSNIVQAGLTARLEKLVYSESDLRSFFEAMSPANNIHVKEKSRKAEWIGSVGASFNMINIKGDDFNVPSNYQSSVAPLIAIQYMVPVDRNFGRYFIYPQLRLYNYKNTGEENQGTFIKSVTYKASLVASIDMNGGANIINKDNLRFFISGGIGMQMQASSKEITQFYAASDHSAYGSPSEIELPSLTFCINASTGVIFNNKIVVSATYAAPSSITNFKNYTANLSGIQCKLGYIF